MKTNKILIPIITALLLISTLALAGSELTDQRWLLDNETAVTDYYLNISDGNTPIFMINPAGQVGIGTSSLNDALNLVVFPGNQGITVNNTGTGSAWVRLFNGGSAGIGYYISSTGSDNTPDGGAGNFVIGSLINDSGTNLLTLQRDGNVGMGITNPISELQLVGIGAGNQAGFTMSSDTSDSGVIISLERFSNNASYFGIETGKANRDTLEIYAPGTIGLVMDTNGNIGINTTTPDSNTAFHVEGGDVRFNGTGDATGFYYNQTSGNVGIGTTAPGSILDVQAANPTVTVTATTGTNGAAVKFTNTAGSGYIGLQNSAGNNLIATGGIPYYMAIDTAASDTYGGIQFATGLAQSAKMTILPNGNVGIGTTDPQDKLSVQGNIILNDSIRGIKLNMDSSGQGNMSYIAFDEDTSDGIVSGSDYFYLGRDGSNAFFDNLGTGDFALMINSVSKLAINGSTNHINLGYSVDTVNITGHIFNSSGMTSDQDIDLTGPNAQLNVIGASDSGIRLGSIGSNIKRMSADGHMQINSETTIIEMADDLNITTATNPRINFAGGGYIYDNGTAVIIGHE